MLNIYFLTSFLCGVPFVYCISQHYLLIVSLWGKEWTHCENSYICDIIYNFWLTDEKTQIDSNFQLQTETY